MAKKSARKKVTSTVIKNRIKAAGYILPHGYEIRKKKRKR